MEALQSHAAAAYAISYFGAMIIVALFESVVPRRTSGDTLPLRWFGNVAITILNTFLVRVFFPTAGVAWALVCRERGWGLFNQLTWPTWVEYTAVVVTLDLYAYGQHYLLHRFNLLWRLHRTHHSDQEYDLTTGLRFHPLEMVLTTLLQMAVLTALGAPPLAALISQLIATVVGFVEHANVRIPARLDRVIRLIFVTPDMHRVHHSIASGESQSNLSSTFSWWDRLFGTYIDQPAAGHANITFGVEGFAERKHLTLPWMLAQPFLPEPDGGQILIFAEGEDLIPTFTSADAVRRPRPGGPSHSPRGHHQAPPSVR